MKYTLLAVALVAACALAAPTVDDVVPETDFMYISYKESMVTLKGQYSQIQSELQAKAYMQVTPGVKEVIDKMVAMVEDQIEPAIKEAHRADQDILNAKMAAVAQINQQMIEDDKMLQSQADIVRGLINDQQAAAQAWDNAAALFVKTEKNYLSVYDEQTKTCCARDNAAVLDVQYVPAYAACDYKDQESSGRCAERAADAVADIVENPFEEGLALYRKLRRECKQLTEELAAADEDTAHKFGECGSRKLEEKAAAKLATEQEKIVQQRWDDTVEWYNGNYTAAMLDYDTEHIRVEHDEADRVSEWGASGTIKCMLLNYKEGGGFDDAAQKKCEASVEIKGVVDIGYPARVHQLVPELEPFEPHTDTAAYENTCDARIPAPEFTCVVKEARPLPQCNPAAVALD
jgi:hypothetical protein